MTQPRSSYLRHGLSLEELEAAWRQAVETHTHTAAYEDCQVAVETQSRYVAAKRAAEQALGRPGGESAAPGATATELAILYALMGADEDLHVVLDEMSAREQRNLYHAADRLRVTIWGRLRYPGGVHESVEPGATVWFCAICDAPNASHNYPAEPCPVCGATTVRSGSISGRTT